MISLASTLPNSNSGYVAAAYIVFLAIVLIYVAIMAARLGRVERKVEELHNQNRGVPTRARESALGGQPNSHDLEPPGQERTLKGTGETV
jgi:hypothetical protein